MIDVNPEENLQSYFVAPEKLRIKLKLGVFIAGLIIDQWERTWWA